MRAHAPARDGWGEGSCAVMIRPRSYRDLPFRFGAWRSLVAHLHGVQGVASSNLAAPTNQFSLLQRQHELLVGAAVYSSVYSCAASSNPFSATALERFGSVLIANRADMRWAYVRRR